MRFSTGQTIGRYVVETLLGEGGMGEVYRARDSRLERSVALKVLRNQAEVDGDEWNHAVMRMQREAKAVAALSHPTIVAIYDVDEYEGSPYIAMELVSGKPLRDLIGTDATMTRRLRIMLDVARALEVAHQADIVHRDVKPDNILVREDGTAKVLDFGIARRTSQTVENAARDVNANDQTVDAAPATMTVEGALVGTPAYMAPEQLRGEPVDARADQFAWGVVAYELLTGRHPFHAEKGGATLLGAILGDTPEPLTGIPAGIAKVVMRTLEKQPEDRWPSMRDVVQQWSAFITGEDNSQISPDVHTSAPVVTHREPERTNAAEGHRARRGAMAGATIGAIAIAAIAVGVRQSAVQNTAAMAVMALSAQPPAGPVAVTDLPIPATESLEARGAFKEGLQAVRDARWSTAVMAFDRARKADPSMAAAHLRFALVNFTFGVQSAREAFAKAQGLRGSLLERDQGLLQAMEPFIMHDPSDYETAATRLEALTANYPNDTELVFWNAHVNWKMNSDRGRAKAIDLAKKCTKLDPKHADCWQVQSWIAKAENRPEDANAALDQCILASENAFDCLEEKLTMDALHGRCPVVIDSVRKWMVQDPTSPRPRRMLTEALFYSGEPEPVVDLAVNETESILEKLGRSFEATDHRAFKALGFGDFDTALRETDSMVNSREAPGAFKGIHLWISRAAIRAEMGDTQGASKIADDFFAQTALHPLNTELQAVGSTIVMNAIKLDAGTMTKSAYEAARKTWLERYEVKDDKSITSRWFAAYAAPANTKELAEEALRQLDALAPKWIKKDPSALPHSLSRAKGRLLSLAGRSAEARQYLEKTTSICLQSESVLYHVQDIARLGIAREATGDNAGACKSYQWVLAHWGKSKQSVTAKEVAKRSKSLGCEAPAM